ncbi:hypothetical protein [Streptomyces sp. NPDC020817]|uniref:hypothetical protein n=1 Tax=Streptomyces sp. NPDC020817 TaxID=3365095 RepID=UPI00379C69AA
MAPQREIDEQTAGGQLAAFLVGLTQNTPVRDLADRFGRSSSSWGNYLNGSQLIPRPLVGRLLESFTVPGPTRNAKTVQALQLWNAADTERRAGRSPSGGGDLVRQHQRRDDALQQVIKYQALAANAEKHLAELRPMLAYTQSRLENTELQLQLGDERERVRMERQLGQARERLARVRIQQERARNRRMTSEELQEFWMAEVLAAQDEIRRLEREAQNLEVIPPATIEPVRQDLVPEADDAGFDARLEFITAEGMQDQALIEEDLQRPDQSDTAGEQEDRAVHRHVQVLSNNGLDKPRTNHDGQILTTMASAAGLDDSYSAQPGKSNPEADRTPEQHDADHGAGSASQSLREAAAKIYVIADGLDEDVHEITLKIRRFVLPIPMLALCFVLYWFVQSIPMDGKSAIVVLATQIALATSAGVLLYGSLRAATVPKLPARIGAVACHMTWCVLLASGLLPWPPLGT